MSKIFVYKIVADIGGAPCVWHGLLSLALCKPKIRKSSEVESLIFGFGGKNYDERLIYIAKVTHKPAVGAYYLAGTFENRPDCIYEKIGGEARRKKTAVYHAYTDERRKDVGRRFENAYVLLSRDFRYFGKKGSVDYKSSFPAIKKLVEGLTQGHRVNHSRRVRSELLDLQKHVWKRFSKMKIGQPTESETVRLCNENTPSAECD